MIDLYTGTPGSGKSLHLANKIRWCAKTHKYCIVNFPVSLKKNQKYIVQLDNSEITPDFLYRFSHDWEIAHGRKPKENEITLIIDEAQLLFNCRDWGDKARSGWIAFFTNHRKEGYHIILVCQFDQMIDKQLRSLVEYQHIHRKVSNFGWKGWLLCALMLSPVLFVDVVVWYAMKQQTGSEFFRFNPLDARIYDTRFSFDGAKKRAGEGEQYLTKYFGEQKEIEKIEFNEIKVDELGYLS